MEGQVVVECAFKKMGISLKVEHVPWTRAQVGTEEGVYDGFFMASKNSRRDSYAIFSQPFMKVEWVYVTRRRDQLQKSDEDFSRKIFAANVGSSRLHWLTKKYRNREISNEVLTAETTEQLLKMLIVSRMDIVLENASNIEKIVAEGKIDMSNLEIFPAHERPLAVYFGQSFIESNPDFLKAYNASIARCTES